MKLFDDIYRGRRVLVTGHTGFKGSWLTMWLEQLGATIGGFSSDVPSRPSNFEILGIEKRLMHYVGDVRDSKQLSAAVHDFQPNFVFHLAAQALVRNSLADPAATFETNVMGMVNVLEVVRSNPKIDAAILITSDKAYRNEEWSWGYREIDALGGKDPYSASKSCADLIAQSYFNSFMKEGPTRLAIARAGNVIGGGDWADDRIVPDCVRAWSGGKAVAVRSPRATRPWQHVLEPVGGYLWLGAKLLSNAKNVDGEAYNFGPDAKVNQTVAELIQAMTLRWPGASWGVPAGCETRGEEATLLKLSCDKALAHLGWSSVLRFDETVALTADWYSAWNTQSVDMLSMTKSQIEIYTRLGRERGAPWVAR